MFDSISKSNLMLMHANIPRYAFYLFCLLVLSLSGCVKTPPAPTDDFVDTSVQFLGHKGAGSNNYNDVNMEHSLASFQQAMLTMDGVEIDMEMSLDGTIWLFHDTEINSELCTPQATNSIINMHDADIEALQLCSRTKTGRVYKLSELKNYWNSYPNGFYISLEVKEYFSNAEYTAAGGYAHYFNTLADRLDATMSGLAHPSKMFLLEVSQKAFWDTLKTYPFASHVSAVLFEYKPFAQVVADAKTWGFNGVSVDFIDNTITTTGVRNAQDDGLIVQIWTPYTYDEVLPVFNMHPDFIQTDNIAIKSELHVR
jgi:glycerophosphoryl diester phosphodiesterase